MKNNIKRISVYLLSMFLLTSCAVGQKSPKPTPIPYKVTDYNGIYKLDSLGKEFVMKRDGITEKYTVTKQDAVELENIKKAVVTFSKYTNSPAISIEFDAIGTTKFKELTQNNIGKQLAFIFNNKLLICPKVQSAITQGKVEITSNLSLQETSSIVAYINENK